MVKNKSVQSGFTLIELIVVVSIIGVLAAVAVVHVKNMNRRARETALKDNLHSMRKAIDNFYADKQRYPSDLNELVPNYLKKIPTDPVSLEADWDIVMEEMDPDAPENTDAEGNPIAPGVQDVRSKAIGKTLENVPYSEL
jgi:general secretion pathway protein G